MRIINLGTYPPKQCGIAAFSSDLSAQLRRLGHTVDIIAVSDQSYPYIYPPEVLFEIRQDEPSDYLRAAQRIEQYAPDAVLIQHEYGIYGGECGELILKIVEELHKTPIPCFMVAHTVLSSPGWKQQSIFWQLSQRVQRIITMNEQSRRILEEVYGIPREKTVYIPHGVPDFPSENRQVLKHRYGLDGKKIVSTFGLIGPGKGLELGLSAFSMIARNHPDTCYLILGETHPMLLKNEGESYRERLQQQVEESNLNEQVLFVNHFLSEQELGDYLHLTDVYFSPYPNLEQSVSGTMAFAIGCGCAIVSTPYAYATENLSGGYGLLSRSVSAEELASLLAAALDDELLRGTLQQKAFERGKNWHWSTVARRYVHCLETTGLYTPLSNLSEKGAKPFHAEL